MTTTLKQLSVRNIGKPRSKRVRKIATALRTLVGTIGTSAYFANYPNFSAIMFISGAVIDFVLECMPNEDEEIESKSTVEEIK